ncbi:MAG: hypothetical protein M3N98_07255 [Actinomycetota bacterium]|nr:hypothetical protein [Actinomycetota bacterium]
MSGTAQLNGSDPTSPVEVSRAFVSAVVWGEHLTIWDMLTPEAQRAVITIAANRGMDERLAARLRDGTAARGERETFLTDLVNGLRADLRGNDLDAVDYRLDPDAGFAGPDEARVMLLAPMLEGLGAPLPVASVELVQLDSRWRVARLLPTRART